MNGRAIDLGCGTAPYKEDVLNVADEYIGVDWKSSLHDQSHVNVFADLCKTLPFPDEHADTVVSFQVMEHLPEPDSFLSECHRILKHGGVLSPCLLCGMCMKPLVTITAIHAMDWNIC